MGRTVMRLEFEFKFTSVEVDDHGKEPWMYEA